MANLCISQHVNQFDRKAAIRDNLVPIYKAWLCVTFPMIGQIADKQKANQSVTFAGSYIARKKHTNSYDPIYVVPVLSDRYKLKWF